MLTPKHKPNCSSNMACAVDHQGSPCPGYKQCDCAELPNMPSPKPTIEKIAKELAEKIVYLGGVLHPNDILPDIRTALEDYRQEVFEEVREKLENVVYCGRHRSNNEYEDCRVCETGKKIQTAIEAILKEIK